MVSGFAISLVKTPNVLGLEGVPSALYTGIIGGSNTAAPVREEKKSSSGALNFCVVEIRCQV